MTIYGPTFFKPSKADFVPKRREISDVTNAFEPTVTTTEEHGYEVGQLIRLHVSDRYGMTIDGETATVLSIPTTTTFTCNYDTRSSNTYTTPTYSDGNGFTQSHVVPITGEANNIA